MSTSFSKKFCRGGATAVLVSARRDWRLLRSTAWTAAPVGWSRRRAFVHPRGPVLRQPPPGRRRSLYPSPQPCPSPASLAKGRGTAVRRWRDSAPSSALGAGIPVSSAPPPAWPTEAGSPEAQRRMSRCKTGIRLQQARRSGPAPPGPWRPC